MPTTIRIRTRKPKATEAPSKLDLVEGLIRNDVYASTFFHGDNLTEYREALLDFIKDLRKARKHE